MAFISANVLTVHRYSLSGMNFNFFQAKYYYDVDKKIFTMINKESVIHNKTCKIYFIPLEISLVEGFERGADKSVGESLWICVQSKLPT